jgi:hypothetical protein
MQVSGLAYENQKTMPPAHNVPIQRRFKAAIDFPGLDSIRNQKGPKNR